mmetsp:Transcript_17186/g.37087  ORF Transcript_17186/g.37087 Transcript_17186/m.37087 type:complete len:979 (-) Transcript_17186:27-2963(-)
MNMSASGALVVEEVDPATKPPPPSIATPASTTQAVSSRRSPRRLGVLQCPNAESLGWGGDGRGHDTTTATTTKDGSSDNNDVAAPTTPARTQKEAIVPSPPAASSLKSDHTSGTTPYSYAREVGRDCVTEMTKTEGSPVRKQDSEASSKKRPRPSSTIHPVDESAFKISYTNDSYGHDGGKDDDDELSETKEPMKGGDDDRAGISSEPATSDKVEPPHYLTATLDYEQTNDGVSERRPCRVLTVTYRGGESARTMSQNSSTVVGKISGRARLNLLPPLSKANEKESCPPETTAAEGGLLRQPTVSLDVFGYRITQVNNLENCHSIIINRPDWMISLPISVVIRDDSPNLTEGTTAPLKLRVRIQSLLDNDNNEKGPFTSGVDGSNGSEFYYSAYPDESYQLNVLPPKSMYPGNYTAAGSGVCTILEPWKDNLDRITDGMTIVMDSVNSSGNPMSKMDRLSDDRVRASGMNADDGAAEQDQQQWSTLTKQLEESHTHKILICGAKGVGKSTLLRYAVNRILSAPSNDGGFRQCTRSVAILDLDCGQPELSPPGMMTLTVVSRPLLSDPPVHMACGGSCDHYGLRLAGGDVGGAGNDDKGKGGGESVQHSAAYFFGDITSKTDPDTYVQMTRQLIRRYNEILKLHKTQHGSESKVPLLVNTDGWVKGLGFEILSAIIGVVNPGHILQIMGNTKAKSFDMSSHDGLASPDGGGRLLRVIPLFDESLLDGDDDDDNRSRRSMDSSGSNGPLLASAADHRVHRLCAYFLRGHDAMTNLRSKIPGEAESISFHKERGLHDPNDVIGMALAAARPYAVPFRSVRVYPPSGLLDGSPSSNLGSMWGVRGDTVCDDVLECLNGAIVGLCCSDDRREEDAVSGPLSNCNNDGAGVPVLDCVGLGIIRSIDHLRQVFFVLTPVHPRLLANVTSFVGGHVGLPLECVYRGVHSDSFPYLSCSGARHGVAASLGAEVMKSRNHSRKCVKKV